MLGLLGGCDDPLEIIYHEEDGTMTINWSLGIRPDARRKTQRLEVKATPSGYFTLSDRVPDPEYWWYRHYSTTLEYRGDGRMCIYRAGGPNSPSSCGTLYRRCE